MMDWAFVVTAFVTMFVVIDPVGLAPLFVALTAGMSRAQRVQVAMRACLTAMIVLIFFAVLGDALLGFVGISMPAFRIAGGILLFLTALDMLFERRSQRREGTAEDEIARHDPSVFPLAIPLIAGPGAIASIILLAGQQPSLAGIGLVLCVSAGVVALVLALFVSAGLIEAALGKTGVVVITRVLGMLLAALSVQFVLDGLRDLGLIFGPLG